MDWTYQIGVPSSFTEKHIDEVYDLAVSGGQVMIDGLRDRILNSYLIGVILINDEVVSTGIIKRPNGSYKKRVFRKAGVERYAENFEFELGYFYTVKEHRKKGMGSSLCEQICSKINGIEVYATSEIGNETMHRILLRHGFAITGEPYLNNDNTILLFTKSKMNG